MMILTKAKATLNMTEECEVSGSRQSWTRREATASLLGRSERRAITPSSRGTGQIPVGGHRNRPETGTEPVTSAVSSAVRGVSCLGWNFPRPAAQPNVQDLITSNSIQTNLSGPRPSTPASSRGGAWWTTIMRAEGPTLTFSYLNTESFSFIIQLIFLSLQRRRLSLLQLKSRSGLSCHQRTENFSTLAIMIQPYL